jgi:ADP-heptose:LPS heptosyltransferase
MIPDHAIWLRLPRFVGDAAMQMSVLRLLRNMGEGPLVVWGPKIMTDMLANTDLCDAVLPDEGKPGPWVLSRILRQHQAKASIHFPKSMRPALAAFLARVPLRIGVNESWAGPLNTHSGPFWEAEGPFLLRYHAVLKKAFPQAPAMPFADFDPGLPPPRPVGTYVCLMPGSTWPSKAWPAAHFRALVGKARAAGLDSVILGTPNEAALCAEVAGSKALDLCGKTSLKEAAAWLRGARGAVGNDSGLSHLAAACGTPIVALYGATDPEGSAPWGPRTLALKREGVPCAPCFKPQCTVEGQPCLAGIPPDEVWDRVLELLRA